MDNITTLDFKDLRIERQNNNDNKVYNAIKEYNHDEFMKNINEKKLKKCFEILNVENITELFNICENNNIYTKFVSALTSILASRQGCKDERLQIEVCSNIAKKRGIIVKTLNNKEYIISECGNIISGKKIKNVKDKCHKSLDGQINGVINGWIFAKILYTAGGHQDNVFIEIRNFCTWIKTHNKTETFIILIDTDLTDKLNKVKMDYSDNKNIYFFNHIEMQNFILTYPLL